MGWGLWLLTLLDSKERIEPFRSRSEFKSQNLAFAVSMSFSHHNKVKKKQNKNKPHQLSHDEVKGYLYSFIKTN